MDPKIKHELENKIGPVYLNLKVIKKLLSMDSDILPEETVIKSDNIKKIDKCLNELFECVNDIKKIIEIYE